MTDRNARRNERMATDPVYREKILKDNRERNRKRYHENPEFRKRRIEEVKEYQTRRYYTDVDYYEKVNERSRKYAKEKRSDPEFIRKETERRLKREERLRHEFKHYLLILQGSRCNICGQDYRKKGELNMFELGYIKRNGYHRLVNTQVVCRRCFEKHNIEPMRPKTCYDHLVRNLKRKYEQPKQKG